MKKYVFIATAASLMVGACSTTNITPVTESTPPAKSIPDSRAGVESIPAQSPGGQIVIPKADQQVLTLDPKPPVTHKKVPAPTKLPHKEECQSCDVEKVWKRYCEGKILTPTEMKILNANDMPDSLKNIHQSCDPAWQGEK